jgi:type IV pilus assembly protein PilX
LLLVLTIIGVSVMQMTRMQERMAGNSSDVSIAFQGAESGLRGAETKVLSFIVRPAECSTTGAVCDSVYAKDTVGVLNMKDKEFWDANAVKFSDAHVAEDLEEEPQFIIEKLAFVPYSLEFAEATGRDFYQTSGRSTGASGNAVAVVQSTFARQAN